MNLLHDVRPAVERFALAMELELRENDHKGGWGGCSSWYLLRRLREEVAELEQAVSNRNKWPRAEVRHEAADVANFAMMIADLFSDIQGVEWWKE